MRTTLSTFIFPILHVEIHAPFIGKDIHSMPRDYSDSESDSGSSVGSIVEERSEADETTFKCLFCDQQFARVPTMSSHCTSEHGFDLDETVKNLGSSESCRTFPIWVITNIMQRRTRLISSS